MIRLLLPLTLFLFVACGDVESGGLQAPTFEGAVDTQSISARLLTDNNWCAHNLQKKIFKKIFFNKGTSKMYTKVYHLQNGDINRKELVGSFEGQWSLLASNYLRTKSYKGVSQSAPVFFESRARNDIKMKIEAKDFLGSEDGSISVNDSGGVTVYSSCNDPIN